MGMLLPTARRLIALADWPVVDRTPWEVGLVGTYATTLKPKMLDAIIEGYGCWLSALTELGLLDQDQPPAERVTTDAGTSFIEVLGARKNSSRTIRTRLSQFGLTLRILAPQTSFTWLHPRKLLGLGDRLAKRPEDQWANWPAIDRQLWERGLVQGDRLDGPNYASKLRPATLKSVVTGYRRWLVFLTENNLLNSARSPAARVKPANIRGYFNSLRESQCNGSVIARMTELRRAMRIMHPEVDFQWLTSPRGRSLESLLPVVPRPIQIIDTKVLYEWGRSMMTEAAQEADPEHRRVKYRNGLLIAIFAARAPRVKSTASLHLGTTLLRNGAFYRLIFAHEDIKTNKHLEYDTPMGLSVAIDHYIVAIRADLLTGHDHGWFWVNQYDEPLSKAEIADMIQRKSKEAFGTGFGPHRFRHALGTTAPLKDPAHPGIAAAILGSSGRMVEEHYNRATQANVAAKFGSSLDKSRAEHRILAGRAFGWEEDD